MQQLSFSGESFPQATIIHIGQNIDRHGASAAFANEPFIDYFAFVNPGHLAQYSFTPSQINIKIYFDQKYRSMWESIYSHIEVMAKSRKIQSFGLVVGPNWDCELGQKQCLG